MRLQKHLIPLSNSAPGSLFVQLGEQVYLGPVWSAGLDAWRVAVWHDDRQWRYGNIEGERADWLLDLIADGRLESATVAAVGPRGEDGTYPVVIRVIARG
jgi:hypothetical protein